MLPQKHENDIDGVLRKMGSVCFGKLRYHGMKTKQQSTKKGTGNSNRGVELSSELCNIAINRYSCSYCRHKMNKELGK